MSKIAVLAEALRRAEGEHALNEAEERRILKLAESGRWRDMFTENEFVARGNVNASDLAKTGVAVQTAYNELFQFALAEARGDESAAKLLMLSAGAKAIEDRERALDHIVLTPEERRLRQELEAKAPATSAVGGSQKTSPSKTFDDLINRTADGKNGQLAKQTLNGPNRRVELTSEERRLQEEIPVANGQDKRPITEPAKVVQERFVSKERSEPPARKTFDDLIKDFKGRDDDFDGPS